MSDQGKFIEALDAVKNIAVSQNNSLTKEEIKKYNLEDVITLNNYEYKVIGWGDLETRFNDDRNIERNKNKDKER